MVKWIGVVVAAVATLLFIPLATAGGSFSRASSADPSVLALVRLLESARFDRIDFDSVETADNGRSVRLRGVKALVFEGYVLTTEMITASGVSRVGSRISAETMVFAEPYIRRSDDSGVSIKSKQMKFVTPETVVVPGKIARLKFSRFLVADSKVTDQETVVATFKEASLDAADWLPEGEVAKKMAGHFVGSISSKLFAGTLPFDLSSVVSGNLLLESSGSVEIDADGGVRSLVNVNTKAVGNYEFQINLNGVPNSAFTTLRELEETTRNDGGSSKPILESSKMAKVMDGVSVGPVSIRATGMEWVGPALEKFAKSKRKSRAKVEREITEIVGGWISAVASAETAAASKREILKFMAEPHAFSVQMFPANPSKVGNNWFLGIIGTPLDTIGFSMKAN